MANNKNTNEELVGTDIFALDDRELRRHIEALQIERRELKQSVVPSVSECDKLIALAHSELSSRATNRMAKLALSLSVVAILVTCAAAVLPLFAS